MQTSAVILTTITLTFPLFFPTSMSCQFCDGKFIQQKKELSLMSFMSQGMLRRTVIASLMYKRTGLIEPGDQ